MERIVTQHNKAHYDSVTDAWVYIMGDNLHYGYFKSEDMDLNAATTCLIDILADMAPPHESVILDVGCGIGGPAFCLHQKYHCSLIGISTSKRGVELARQAAEVKGYAETIQFQVADALNNGFPDNYFDLVWQMESSHLMRDKTKLFAENFRVLKTQGTLLLCDQILKREFTVIDLYKYQKELNVIEKSFGKAKTETLGFYRQALQEAGFPNVETIDVSQWVQPTLKHWQNNIFQNRETIANHFTNDQIDNFLSACEILNDLFANDIFGYGLVKAKKDEN